MSKLSSDNNNLKPKSPPLGGNRGEPIKGFSKLDRSERIAVLNFWLGEELVAELDSFLHLNPQLQNTFSEFSENYLTNFYLPYGLVPNVLINGRLYLVPVVVEESSVVAAASRAAGFWAKNGGFKTEVLGTVKKGQVHFIWTGVPDLLTTGFSKLKKRLLKSTEELTEGMRQRGGGITEIELVDLNHKVDNYFQLDVSFETSNAMGANFINSCLEKMADELKAYMNAFTASGKLEVIMSILSNYTPESAVKCTVECPVEALSAISGENSAKEFAQRFKLAIQMANCDVSRAVTHNKGIYNGVDGVVLATGNDWRAVEAAGHAFASRNGEYRSLSSIEINDNIFRYSITLPLAVGTVGGLTKSHPLAKLALKLLGNPSSEKLMEIIAALGMANNFSAVTSLVTSGIQKGHMKMHLSNILNQLGANDSQKQNAIAFFKDRNVSFSAVKAFLEV